LEDDDEPVGDGGWNGGVPLNVRNQGKKPTILEVFWRFFGGFLEVFWRFLSIKSENNGG